MEVYDEFDRKRLPNFTKETKNFLGNFDSNDDRPIKPSSSGNGYDLQSIPKSAINVT